MSKTVSEAHIRIDDHERRLDFNDNKTMPDVWKKFDQQDTEDRRVANRLPVWATIVISLLTFALGAAVKGLFT